MYRLKQTTTWTCWRLWPLEESPAGLWTDTCREIDDRTPSMTIFCRALLAAVSGILITGDVLGEALGVVLGEHRGTDPEGGESVSYCVILERTFKLLEYIKENWFLFFFVCLAITICLKLHLKCLTKQAKIVWNFVNIDFEKLQFFYLCKFVFNVSAFSMCSRDLALLVLFGDTQISRFFRFLLTLFDGECIIFQ